MARFSDDQLIAIAQQFHDLSIMVSQFRLDRIHCGIPLDDPGIVQLLGLQRTLLTKRLVVLLHPSSKRNARGRGSSSCSDHGSHQRGHKRNQNAASGQ